MPEESTPPAEETAQAAPAPAAKSDDNLTAALSYLWILSIIILLVKKDSDYVKFHARQGVVIFAASIVIWFVGAILPFLVPLVWLVDLVILVAVIMGFIKAYGGQRYKMPLVGDIAESINL